MGWEQGKENVLLCRAGDARQHGAVPSPKGGSYKMFCCRMAQVRLCLKEACWHAWTRHALPTSAGRWTPGEAFCLLKGSTGCTEYLFLLAEDLSTGLLCWSE